MALLNILGSLLKISGRMFVSVDRGWGDGGGGKGGGCWGKKGLKERKKETGHG